MHVLASIYTQLVTVNHHIIANAMMEYKMYILASGIFNLSVLSAYNIYDIILQYDIIVTYKYQVIYLLRRVR